MKLSDSLYVGLIVVFLVVSLLGIAFLGAPRTSTGVMNATQEFAVDISGEQTTVASDGMYMLCLGSGCIPAIDSPTFQRAEEAVWLEPGDLVIAASQGGEHYAFPLRVLRLHSVVNTRIGGDPVAVTYSPYSGVLGVFSREVDGRTLTFEHAGKLYQGNMVMRDRETGTFWSQFTAEGLRGEKTGERLQTVKADIVRWDVWRRAHRDGTVLSRETGIYGEVAYMDRPFFGYRMSRDTPVTPFESDIHPKTVVYGLAVGGEATAYRQVDVKARDIVQETIGGQDVMVVQDEETGRIIAFSRDVDGSTLTFRIEDGRLRDETTGSVWTMDGEAVEGGMAGAELQRLRLMRSYWFVWKQFYPDTGRFGGGR